MNTPAPNTRLSVGDLLMEIKESDYGNSGTKVISLMGNNHNARIWFRLYAERAEIAGMYVAAREQRRGYATALFQALLQHYPHIRKWTTASATPKGRRWLEANGFSRPSPLDEWALIVKKK